MSTIGWEIVLLVIKRLLFGDMPRERKVVWNLSQFRLACIDGNTVYFLLENLEGNLKNVVDITREGVYDQQFCAIFCS